jgi:hypothetical protein
MACSREDLRPAIEAFSLPVEHPTGEETLAAAITAFYLTRFIFLSFLLVFAVCGLCDFENATTPLLYIT